MNNNGNQKVGLVFSGGGAKGSYQIGVWQALIDLGIDKKITGLAGTSVGAINSVLFAQGNIDMAYELWKEAKMPAIQPEKAKHFRKILIKFIGSGNYQAAYHLINSEFLSSKTLKDKIEEHLDSTRIKGFAGPCFITGHDKKNNCPKYFEIKDYCKDDQVKIIMASLAMPYIFKSIKIEGSKYVDGGVSDNTPIMPLYQAGYNPIIVVYLATTFHHIKDYPNCQLIHLYPSESLGDFKDGTLNFEGKKISRNLRLGYTDTMRSVRYLRGLQELLPLSPVDIINLK